MATTFENKAAILAELWLDYRESEEFAEFISSNDIGLPLAYVVSNGIVKTTKEATKFIEDTFSEFLSLCGYEDLNFESLDEILPGLDD